jgi:patatin-like phospholipase/acyl hydrolase
MQKSKKIVLFNYGGGLRGLIPAHIMSHIEDKTGLRMVDMIDIFSGPSTGAILNAALNVPHPDGSGRPKYRARHMVKFYEREGRHIFPPDRFRDFRALLHDFNNRTMKIGHLKSLLRLGHYNPDHLQHCLKMLYGETQLNQALKTLIIPVYNIDGSSLTALTEYGESDEAPVHTKNNFIDEGGHAVWLKHIRPPLRAVNKTPGVSMFDAVMGSTAAPTYFPCHHFGIDFRDSRGQREVTAIDGSIFDNPCVSYHGAIRRHLNDSDDVVMLMLGTGYTHKSITKDSWNSFGNLGVVDPVNDLPLINILFQAPESALVESFYDELGDDLHVYNKSITSCDPAIRPSPQIDDAQPENLARLKDFAMAILEDKASEFDALCHMLVSNRDLKEKERQHDVRENRGFFSFFRV